MNPNRIQKIQTILTERKIDALLVSSSINIRYITGYSGFMSEERDAYIFVTKKYAILFTNTLYFDEVKKSVKDPIKVFLITQLQKTLEEFLKHEKITNIGFEENLTYSEYIRFKKLIGVKLKLAESIIEEIRTIKDQTELKSLHKACNLTDSALDYVLKKIRNGITELELAWEIEKFIHEHGGELGFPSIIAFGKNSAIPHHKTDETKLKSSSIVLLDFGAKAGGYCADMTRTVFFGKAPEKFKRMYETVRIGQEKGFKPKMFTPQDLDKIPRDYIISQGYPNIPHSVGHGVGLAVHELPHISPGIKEKINPNTPFTIEPGIYINGFGGVRIEDTVYFDGEKINLLTQSPKNLIEL